MFEIPADHDYRLEASRGFLCGFVPASGLAAGDGERLVLGMCRDDDLAPVAVTVVQRGARLRCEGAIDAAQIARVLSLDVDAGGWLELGRREPAIGALQRRWPGFRPPLFGTPYEAALWGILSARLPMRRAAALRLELARALGGVVEVDGLEVVCSPPPERLAAVDRFAGVSDEKLRRLRGVARAALDGRLDAARLRGLPEAEALADLAELRGVGRWTAAHILHRGAGSVDALPAHEPRVLRGIARAFGLARPPDVAGLAALAEPWRPYRMWVAILATRALAATAGWNAPGDSARRAAGS